MAEQYRQEIEALLAVDPDAMTRPWVRREYLGEWCPLAADLVYQGYSEAVNTIPSWKAPEKDDDRYAIAIDAGYDDRCAFVVGHWSRSTPRLTILEASSHAHLDVELVEAKLRYCRDTYPQARVLIDARWTALADHLRKRCRFPIEKPPKTDKASAIAAFNGDLRHGKVVAVAPSCKQLLDEWRSLQWHTKPNRSRIEEPSQSNDCADAALYIWRIARHWAYAEPEVKQQTILERALEAAREQSRQQSTTWH